MGQRGNYMYKVVIIDDEPVIVEGLKRIIPWSKYNCDVVDTASDGREGIEVIKKWKPDIIYTDIRMPNLDGLTMLAGIKSQFPDMQITVLTGYRDFEYAQTAIRLGVTRFLLKPSKMEELIEALETMTDKLNKITGHIPTESTDADPKDELANSFIVRNALKYIDEHYNEKLTLIEVADNVYVSQWHLSKLLKKHTNQNFCDILNGIRIEQAKKLLRDPSLKIHEISEKIGFTDVTHFSKKFKQIVGVSANEYRNSLK